MQLNRFLVVSPLNEKAIPNPRLLMFSSVHMVERPLSSLLRFQIQGPHGNALKGKRIGIVLTYGDSDPFNSGAVNAMRTYQDAFAYIGSPIVGMVYGSALKPGEIKANRDLMEKAYEMGKQLVAEA